MRRVSLDAFTDNGYLIRASVEESHHRTIANNEFSQRQLAPMSSTTLMQHVPSGRKCIQQQCRSSWHAVRLHHQRVCLPAACPLHACARSCVHLQKQAAQPRLLP